MYIYKQNLALNSLQWLICHKTQPNISKLLMEPYQVLPLWV